MRAWAYYNEIDDYAAEWLRNLIAAGLIAPGVVDERSILDVQPEDLNGYRQCHFFAGLGLWSYALRLAEWPDDRAIWTGSCPCQPFSQTGRGLGFADERHLWPAMFHLATIRRPAVVCGEQVASKDGYAWVDLVQTDMEGLGYAFWSTVFPAAGVGATDIRHRTYWVGLADCAGEGLERHAGNVGGTDGRAGPTGILGELDDAGRASPTNGHWRNADWIFCTDERWRPVEPGTFPLDHGLPRSVGGASPELQRLFAAAGVDRDCLRGAKRYRKGTLKGYGNAINPWAAAEFVDAWKACAP